jgi:hypothetical protein
VTVCTCASTPPTMPTYRAEHLPWCPAYVYAAVLLMERQGIERRDDPVCASQAVTCRAIRDLMDHHAATLDQRNP